MPRGVRVAHKTGEISTIAHDAGVVYPKERKPYVIAVLTEWPPDIGVRSATIADVSFAVYETFTSAMAEGSIAAPGVRTEARRG